MVDPSKSTLELMVPVTEESTAQTDQLTESICDVSSVRPSSESDFGCLGPFDSVITVDSVNTATVSFHHLRSPATCIDLIATHFALIQVTFDLLGLVRWQCFVQQLSKRRRREMLIVLRQVIRFRNHRFTRFHVGGPSRESVSRFDNERHRLCLR